MCLFLILLFFGPRSALLIWWLVDMPRFSLTFDSFWLPFVGFLFAPWTTLMYVFVAPCGVNGFYWFLLGLAVVIDIAGYGAGGRYQQRRGVAAT